MHEDICQSDILQAVTALAVAEMRNSPNVMMSSAVHDACQSLISAGLVPIDVSPEVWRCVNENDAHAVNALRQYINAQ